MTESNRIPELELNKWQIEETNKAIAEADAGDFATDVEVLRAIKTFSKNQRIR
jgi:predicted transcriptional regulator